MVRESERRWHRRRLATHRHDDLFAERSIGQDGHRRHDRFAGSALAFSRSSSDGVCRDFAGTFEAAPNDHKIFAQARAEKSRAGTESLAKEDGFWRAHRALVP